MSFTDYLLIALALLLTACSTSAQFGGGSGYGKLIQLAQAAEDEGRYLDAAGFYRDAYATRPGKPENVYHAAELFARARDYRNASETYALVPEDNLRWPLLGLEYGRALKQAGQSRGAQRVLTQFSNTYNGVDRDLITDLADLEIAGLRLPAPTDTELSVVHLGEAVNSRDNESGPSLSSSGWLLFGSRRGDQRRALASSRIASGWGRATAPPGFPVITGGEFGAGGWSTDGETYFFTICSAGRGPGTDRCEVFLTQRQPSGTWSRPLKLSTNVNAPGVTSITPSAVKLQDGRQEIYFASNRPGGVGGMDLYRATQISTDQPGEFSEPVALDRSVNTAGNEITPVVDSETKALTFASDGHPGYGGYDLFRASFADGRYVATTNAGLPLNSTADDFGLSRPGVSGYQHFVSNRAALPGKATTTDDDIFQIGTEGSTPTLQGAVYADATEVPLSGVRVRVIGTSPQAVSASVHTTTDGAYFIDLVPDQTYRVELSHPNYRSTSYPVETDAAGDAIYGRPIHLTEKLARQQVPGNGPDAATDANADTNAQTTQPVALDPDHTPATAAPVAYRIQITATRTYDPEEPRYAPALRISGVMAEPITGSELQRINLGYYLNIESARADLRRARAAGFPDAFIVRYERGKRIGAVR